MILQSEVPGHEGPCAPVWVNRNQVCHRLDGGVTGFFRNARKRGWFWFRFGPEFHGIIRRGVVQEADK